MTTATRQHTIERTIEPDFKFSHPRPETFTFDELHRMGGVTFNGGHRLMIMNENFTELYLRDEKTRKYELDRRYLREL